MFAASLPRRYATGGCYALTAPRPTLVSPSIPGCRCGPGARDCALAMHRGQTAQVFCWLAFADALGSCVDRGAHCRRKRADPDWLRSRRVLPGSRDAAPHAPRRPRYPP